MGEFDTVMQTRDEVEDCITIKNSLNPSRGLRTMFLFCEKDAYQNMDFSCLKCQLEQKKNNAARFLRFFECRPTRNWLNKVNLSSFQLKTFFKFHSRLQSPLFLLVSGCHCSLAK